MKFYEKDNRPKSHERKNTGVKNSKRLYTGRNSGHNGRLKKLLQFNGNRKPGIK